jgi:hypothetical protein
MSSFWCHQPRPTFRAHRSSLTVLRCQRCEHQTTVRCSTAHSGFRRFRCIGPIWLVQFGFQQFASR